MERSTDYQTDRWTYQLAPPSRQCAATRNPCQASHTSTYIPDAFITAIYVWR